MSDIEIKPHIGWHFDKIQQVTYTRLSSNPENFINPFALKWLYNRALFKTIKHSFNDTLPNHICKTCFIQPRMFQYKIMFANIVVLK